MAVKDEVLVTIARAAMILDVSKGMVNRMIRGGRLKKGVNIWSGPRRSHVTLSSINAVIRSRGGQSQGNRGRKWLAPAWAEKSPTPAEVLTKEVTEPQPEPPTPVVDPVVEEEDEVVRPERFDPTPGAKARPMSTSDELPGACKKCGGIRTRHGAGYRCVSCGK